MAPSIGTVVPAASKPPRKLIAATLSTRAIGSLSVKITTPSSIATATIKGTMAKVVRRETAGLSRSIRKTKYRANEAKGTCKISRASKVRMVASTMRSVAFKRPGVGCRSRQILRASEASEIAGDGIANGGSVPMDGLSIPLSHDRDRRLSEPEE